MNQNVFLLPVSARHFSDGRFTTVGTATEELWHSVPLNDLLMHFHKVGELASEMDILTQTLETLDPTHPIMPPILCILWRMDEH